MKTILIAGLAALLPALAQTPDDLILGARRVRVQDAQVQQLYLRTPGQGAAVKNAPYSADAVTETTQALTDGNRIVQRTTQKLYRDSDGRERREESVLAVGALAQPGAPRVITISDPVDNISYTLDPQQRSARRTPGKAIINWEVPVLSPAGAYAATVRNYWLTVPGIAGRGGAPGATQSVKEDLGSKNVEGVIAQGTRTTETIPAGQIGNQLPIKIVDEVWHSAELQMDVMTTHSDPRSGESVYKLTNINRGNPPRSLFEPPSDYTITGPAAGGAGGRGPAVAVPAPGGRGGGRSAAPGAQR